MVPAVVSRFAQMKGASGSALRTLFSRLDVTHGSVICSSPSSATFGTTSANLNDDDGWLSKLLVRKIDTGKGSHSRLLSDKESIYELTTHNVKPSRMDDYIKAYGDFVELVKEKDNVRMELAGSWVVGVGDQDQVLHLWRHSNGFAGVDETAAVMRCDKDFAALRNKRTPFLRSRRTQYLLSFSYWPPIRFRPGSNLYEIRSYTLKPGTMIEWGNNWARGIGHRTGNDAPYAGFFSQIGVLYQVHHIWTYESLAARKNTRESAWQNSGWDKCVANTVPLIRHMETRIMAPTPFSPTK
ncbi:unnamed protein product [Notodromas monacha]|uniref:NIPSNAP domain-containing protein n=1 Tax=Notodromas monacha TaxID=399045 RepID=A0A7R9BIH5_9CRUS|nr:unnamed protein product [Notodromas monacha]CAG0915332.1 unnamed protein product [Notodromas monacha]